MRSLSNRMVSTNTILRKKLSLLMQIDSTLTTLMLLTCPCSQLCVALRAGRHTWLISLIVYCRPEDVQADQYTSIFFCGTSTTGRDKIPIWCCCNHWYITFSSSQYVDLNVASAEGIMTLHDPSLRALYDLKVRFMLCIRVAPRRRPGICSMRLRSDACTTHSTRCQRAGSECRGCTRTVCFWRPKTSKKTFTSITDTFVMSNPLSTTSFSQHLAMRTL